MKTAHTAILSCINSALFVAVAGAVPAPADRNTASILPMTVRFVMPKICEIDIAGQTFGLPDDQDRMIAALKKLRRNWRSLSISGGVETPYRCIAFAIYLSQRGGFRKIGFKAEPPDR